MPQFMPVIFIYVGLLSLITFFAYGLDKLKAMGKKRRISERSLLLLAWLGGSFGAMTAMVLFHHKTNGKKHPGFCWGVPAAVLLHLGLIYLAGLLHGSLPLW